MVARNSVTQFVDIRLQKAAQDGRKSGDDVGAGERPQGGPPARVYSALLKSEGPQSLRAAHVRRGSLGRVGDLPRAASQHTVLDRLCLAAALSHQKPNSSGSAPRRGSFERASSALGISGMEARRVDPPAWVLFFRGGVGHVLRRCLKVCCSGLDHDAIGRAPCKTRAGRQRPPST